MLEKMIVIDESTSCLFATRPTHMRRFFLEEFKPECFNMTVKHLLKIMIWYGPSIYDVHMERRRGVRLGWTHVDGGGGPAPCGRPHRKLKLESTDVILSSSHAKKLASFLPEFRLWTEKKWKFFCDIN